MSRLLFAFALAFAACGDNLEPTQPDSAIDAGPDAMTVSGPGQLPPRCFPGWHLSPDRTSCVPNADAGT